MADREDDSGTGGEGSSTARPAAGKAGKGLWAPTRGYFQLAAAKSAGAARPAARPAPKKEAAAPGAKPAEAAVPAEASGAAPAAASPAERKEPVPRSATAKPAQPKAEGAKAAAAVKVDPRRDSIATVPTLSESTIENVIGQNLYDAPDSETTLYRVTSLNFLFSVSSALLLFFTVLVAWKDYDRFWKRIQAGWNAELAHRFEKDLEAERARERVMLLEMEPRLGQVLERVRGSDAARVLQEAEALGPTGSPERASALVAGAREGLEKEDRFADYRMLRDKAKDAATRFALKEKALRAFRGDFQAAKFRHDDEKRHIIDVHGDTPRAAELIAEANKKFTESFVLNLEMLGAEVEERHRLDHEASALLAKYVDEHTFIDVEVDLAGETVMKRSSLSTIEGELGEIERGVREAKNKVASVEASWQNAVRNMPLFDFLAPTYKIEKAVLADLHEDLNFGTVPRVDRCKTCHINIDNVDPSVAGFRSEKLGLGSVYASHPRIDLFVGNASPHPYEKFGCTTCHYGDGYSTDFITAAHTPKDRAQREEWEKRFDWEPLHHQDYPMLEKKYITSSCKKCHPDEHSLEGGGTYNLGYEVIKTYGCFGCHKIDAFKDAAKVGPSLLHIADKADIPFLYRWIRDPTHFRPTTRMPRFFDLTNSTGVMLVPTKDGSTKPMDFGDRNGVEALALATYLTATSQRRADLKPLTARGDAARGRETFMTVGCLGCHSVKGESTVGEGEAAGEPHAAVAAALSALRGVAEAPGAKPEVAEAARKAELALSRLLEWFERLAVGENIEASYNRAIAALDALVTLDESVGAEGGPVAVSKAAAKTIYNRWVHNTFAPDLSGIGSKVRSPEWLASWIIDPRKHDPKTVMPRFRFEDDSDGEQKVADIVAYLLTLRDPGFEARDVFSISTPAASRTLDDITYDYKSRQMTRGEARAAVEGMLEDEKLRFVGHRLVRRYGCFGCHLGIADVDSRRTEVRDGVEVTVQGKFDAAEPIGTDLNGWGVKQAAFLDYGNWGHQHSGREAIGHTRYDWVHAKLSDTRRFDVIPAEKEVVKGKEYVYEATNRLIQKTPEELLKMPRFPFHDDEERVDAVVTFLAGLTKDRIPLEKTRKLVGVRKDLEDGSRLIASLNCKGCHRIGAEPQFVQVSSLPRFSQYTESEENTRRGEMEKETWLQRAVRLHAANPGGAVATPKEGGVLLEKGFLLNRLVFDRTTMDPEKDDALSVVEMAAGPTNADSKLPGHFAAFNVPESSRVLPMAGFEEGRIRFYFGTSADQRPNAPPPLVREGERVQGDWLFRFLQDVTPLRLWLKVRMPSFYLTQDEARTIVRWFQANAGVKDSNEIFDEDTLNPEAFEKGQALFGPSVGERIGLQCNSCHPTGDKLPTEPVLTPARKFDYKIFQQEVTIPDNSYYVVWKEPNGAYRLRAGFGDAATATVWAKSEPALRGVGFAIGDPWSKISWGPDLGLAAERLRPPWIRQWLENPPDFMPGTKMPNFFGERSPVEGRVVLKPPTKAGEDRTEVKIQSIIQFLMHMENNRGGAQKTAAGN